MTGNFGTQKIEILVKVCDNIKFPNVIRLNALFLRDTWYFRVKWHDVGN